MGRCRTELATDAESAFGFVGLFEPIIRRQRQSPNVLRFVQRDPTNEGPLRINVDHLGGSTLVGDDDMNLDLQPDTERSRGGNPCSMSVDDNGLTITSQWFSETLSRDHNLQRHTSTSARLRNTPSRHSLLDLHCRRTSQYAAQGAVKQSQHIEL